MTWARCNFKFSTHFATLVLRVMAMGATQLAANGCTEPQDDAPAPALSVTSPTSDDEFLRVAQGAAELVGGNEGSSLWEVGEVSSVGIDSSDESGGQCHAHCGCRWCEEAKSDAGSSVDELRPLTDPAAHFFYLCVEYVWGADALVFPPTLHVHRELCALRAAQGAAALFGGVVAPASAPEWRSALLGAFWSPAAGPLPLVDNPWATALAAVLQGRHLAVSVLLHQTLAARALPYSLRAMFLSPAVCSALAQACAALELQAASEAVRGPLDRLSDRFV